MVTSVVFFRPLCLASHFASRLRLASFAVALREGKGTGARAATGAGDAPSSPSRAVPKTRMPSTSTRTPMQFLLFMTNTPQGIRLPLLPFPSLGERVFEVRCGHLDDLVARLFLIAAIGRLEGHADLEVR